MKRLYLFDYDGSLIDPDISAWESLRHAANRAAGTDSIQISDTDWDALIHQTTGGTERELAKKLVRFLGIPKSDWEQFINRFYQERLSYLVRH